MEIVDVFQMKGDTFLYCVGEEIKKGILAEEFLWKESNLISKLLKPIRRYRDAEALY